MIRPLPEELRGLLARGEVLFSLRDVVRELLENALDAGAKRVRVELYGGGRERAFPEGNTWRAFPEGNTWRAFPEGNTWRAFPEGNTWRIVVEDDGQGIPLAELPLAVEPFATSKLLDPGRITALGFRGQALYALRQAALLRIRSRPRFQVGGGLLLAQGERVEVREVAAPPGTRVEVVGWEGEGSEREVAELLRRYLLHYPWLSLAFFAEGEARLLFPGAGLKEAARLAFGRVLAERLLPVEREAGGMRLQGLLSGPQASRTRPDLLFLAINGRPVAWPEGLLKTVRRAYRELLPEGHFPVGVLNLTLPLEAFRLRLDARKEEVAVLEEAEAFVEEGLREAFQRHNLARSLPEPRPLMPLSPPTPSGLPRLRYLGQFRESYLLAEAGDTLYVVDQHAAHERVIYEEFLRRLKEEGLKALPYPVLVELSPLEESLLPERKEVLASLFALEAFGPGRVRLLAAPSFLHPYPLLLPEIFREALRGEGKSLTELLARLACLPAVKAGHPLSRTEGQALLDALLQCQTPWVCPHGRPTLLALKEEDLIRRFGRRSGARAGEESRPRRPEEGLPEEPWPRGG